MKNRLIITLICILPYIQLMATPPASLSGWEMVFNDEFDGNSFFKYDFKTGVDAKCMKEFLIIDVEEEVDYNKRYKNTSYIDNNNNNNEPSSIASDSIVSKSTNYGKNVIDNENEYINEKEKAKN